MVYDEKGDFRRFGFNTAQGESPLAAPVLLIAVAICTYLAVASAFYSE